MDSRLALHTSLKYLRRDCYTIKVFPFCYGSWLAAPPLPYPPCALTPFWDTVPSLPCDLASDFSCFLGLNELLLEPVQMLSWLIHLFIILHPVRGCPHKDVLRYDLCLKQHQPGGERGVWGASWQTYRAQRDPQWLETNSRMVSLCSCLILCSESIIISLCSGHILLVPIFGTHFITLCFTWLSACCFNYILRQHFAMYLLHFKAAFLPCITPCICWISSHTMSNLEILGIIYDF